MLCYHVTSMVAKPLINRHLVIKNGKYAASLKVFEVGKSKRFPDGIKAKFVLLDIELGFARLLLDNHHPFGFHLHTKLPEDKDHRTPLDVTDYRAALHFFLEEVERIVKNEE